MRILVTRPEAEANDTCERLRAMGHEAVIEPLTVLQATPPANLPAEQISGVLATSRNALAALADHPDLRNFLHLPLFAVGPATGALARRLGFSDVHVGETSAARLIDLVARCLAPSAGALFFPRGRDIAFPLAAELAARGYPVREVIVYTMREVGEMQPETLADLASGRIAAVILMSPRAGKIFASLVSRAGLTDRVGGLLALCLSTAVAATLPPVWSCRIARKPTLEEMLALVAELAPVSGPAPT